MKFKFYVLSTVLIAIINLSYAQYGCTDPQATNYNATATINNGTCTYNSTNLTLTQRANLSTPLLDESSGVEFCNNRLWTHNDGGNTNQIFRVDSVSNLVLQVVTITNATNVDWEDITSSDDFLFVGDIGNNYGNRTDLKIYKINKNNLTDTTTAITAEIINFSYGDQTSFISAVNNNDYDCEAMLFYNDSLHLFSKDWVDKQSRHYVLPATAGTYVTQPRETLNAGYLITGAGIQDGGVIALCGYDNAGLAPIYMYMLYDYRDGLFFNGNKRKFNLASAINNGQVEGIDFKNAAYGFISNERFQKSIFNIPPTLKSFDLAPYLPTAFVYPKPDADFSANAVTICKNKTVSFTDKSKHNPTSWQWIFQGGTPATSTLKNPVVQYSVAGTYSVTLIATNSSGSDTLIMPLYIKVNALPTASITALGATVFCSGGSVVLSANTGTGYTYQWKKDTYKIPGATSSTFTALYSGTYLVIVTNANGCSKTSNSIIVTGPPSAQVTMSGSLTFCAGDSVVFTAVATGAGITYQWQKNNVNIAGATSVTYAAKASGNYRVVVTNSFGCTVKSSPKTVSVNCRNAVSSGDGNLVNIYPNPSQSGFTIEPLFNVDEPLLVEVVDITGRVLQKFNFKASAPIYFGDKLSSGIYFIKVINNDNTALFRVVKH